MKNIEVSKKLVETLLGQDEEQQSAWFDQHQFELDFQGLQRKIVNMQHDAAFNGDDEQHASLSQLLWLSQTWEPCY